MCGSNPTEKGGASLVEGMRRRQRGAAREGLAGLAAKVYIAAQHERIRTQTG